MRDEVATRVVQRDVEPVVRADDRVEARRIVLVARERGRKQRSCDAEHDGNCTCEHANAHGWSSCCRGSGAAPPVDFDT